MKHLLLILFLMITLDASNDLLKKANEFFKKRDYDKAFKLYQKMRTPFAINNLAMMYYFGYGTLPKQGKAVSMLESLLKNKNLNNKERSIVLYNLANMYYNGFVDDKFRLVVDRKKAMKLFLKSKLLGYKPADSFLMKIEKDINESKKK